VATGIGVYFFSTWQMVKTSPLLSKASTPMMPPVLQAEAKALLLAAKIADLLQIDQLTFLMDNQVLAKVTVS
jgi:hypothetical protein